MSRFGSRQVKLVLEIVNVDFDVAHGHLGIGVAEQFHQGRKAHAGTKHLGGICVPQLMRHNASWRVRANDRLGASTRGADGRALFCARACEEKAICR